MKLAPLSSDLVVKLAIGTALACLVWYAYRQAVGKLGSTVDDLKASAGKIADAVIEGTNPANPENVVNRAVTAIGSAVVSADGPGRSADGSWRPGAWLFDIRHPGWADPTNAASGASGSTPIIASQYDALGNYLGVP